MKKKEKINPTKSDTNALEDQEILKFAEEVLSSSDDEILGLEDDAIEPVEEDEDVLDLEDLSAHELDQNDDILDLTEELEGEDEDEDGVLTLEDLTGERASTEEAILDLDSAVDELIVKEEIQNLDENVEETQSLDENVSVPDEVEEESIDLDSMFGDLEGEEDPAETLSEDLTDDGLKLEDTGLTDEIGDMLDENFSGEEKESTEASDELGIGVESSSKNIVPEVENDTVEIALPGDDAFDSDSATEEKTPTPALSKENGGADKEELSLDLEDTEPPQDKESDQIDADDLNFDDILELEGLGNEAEAETSEPDVTANDPHATLDLSDFSSQLEEESGEEEKALSEELEASLSAAEEPEALFDDDLSDLLEDQADESVTEADDSIPETLDTPEPDADDDLFAEKPESPETDIGDAAPETELLLDDLAGSEGDSADSDDADFIDALTVDEPPEPETADVEAAIPGEDEKASTDLDQTEATLDEDVEDHAGEKLQPEEGSDVIPGPYTSEQLDQSVERVVRKVLSEKIDAMLVDAIEQAVTNRIDRLKSLILEDINKSE
jgi:hypothetical protein